MTDISAASVAEFAEHLASRRTDRALAVAMGLADAGVPVAEILTDLIGPAQIEVGERWYRNEFSVADEHAASSVADTVLTLLSAHSTRQEANAPHVLALCPEGEWHTLPLRIMARVFELAGLHVTFLGASLPSDHLGRFLEKMRPDLVALSCSTPLAFDGVLAAVETAHLAGLPVLAGGRTFGFDELRADSLGVDLFSTSAVEGAQLARRAAPTELRTPTAMTGAALALSLDRPRIVAEAMEALRRQFRPMREFTPSQIQRTREDFDFIVQYAEATILVDDIRLFEEFLGWLRPLLANRNVPEAALGQSLNILHQLSSDALGGVLERTVGALNG